MVIHPIPADDPERVARVIAGTHDRSRVEALQRFYDTRKCARHDRQGTVAWAKSWVAPHYLSIGPNARRRVILQGEKRLRFHRVPFEVKRFAGTKSRPSEQFYCVTQMESPFWLFTPATCKIRPACGGKVKFFKSGLFSANCATVGKITVSS